jgi:general secretion pathway protein B
MSFILDALRKSEHERQRQTGPALVESPVAAPTSRTNRWATAAIVLLLINLIALGVVLLTKSRDEKALATATPPGAAPNPAPSTSPSPSGSAPVAAAAATAPASDSPPTQGEPPVARATPAPPPMMRPAGHPPVSSGRNPLQEEIAADPTPSAAEGLAGAAAPPQGPPAVQSRGAVRPGTVVYESLPEAGAEASTASGRPDEARPTSNLPRADEMAARMGGPELRLELHVYSTRAAERMVFINSRRYREGETTPEGAVVEQITPDGVVMSMNGNRFLLPRE